MIHLKNYVERFDSLFDGLGMKTPWNLTGSAARILSDKIRSLGAEYKIVDDVAIHATASIDSHVVLKGPAIISANCFVAAHAVLRGGIFLDENVSVGPACEIKSSFIFANSALAHFNFIGDSLVGSSVNLEAGAVVANHYNERIDKNISVVKDGKTYSTGVEKFGALVGDHCKIGSNAVLSPGTILAPNTIVRRLELIEQDKTGTPDTR